MANESAPGLGLGAADTPGAVAPPTQEAVSDQSGILNWVRGALAEPGQPGWMGDLAASVQKERQAQTPQAPPGQLSDGSINRSFPVNGTPQQQQWSMEKAEAALEQQIRQEMARTKAPSITTQGKIYTADGGVYPNTAFGRAQAEVGGKGAEVMAGTARAATGAVAPGLDLASSVLNATGHKLANVEGRYPNFVPFVGGQPIFRARPELADPKNDIPLVSTSLQQSLGIPGIDPNAPTWQRVLESAGSGVGAGVLKSATTGLTRAVAPAVTQGAEAAASSVTGTAAADAARSIYRNVIGAAAGEGGSQLGAHILKPFGLEEFGSILGGVAAPFAGGVPYSKITRNLVGGLSAKRADVPSVAPDYTRGPDGQLVRSPDVQRAMERANEASGTNPPIGDARDISAAMDRQGLPSSFTALANPVWQRVAKVVASALPLGSHTRSANDALEEAIQGRLHQTGEEIAGVPLPREGVSPGHIGTVLTRGAEQAIPHIDNLVRGIYEPINRTMRAAGDMITTPVVNAIRQAIAGGTLTSEARRAVGGAADELASNSPGGTNYDETARGPAPALPSPEVTTPWDLSKSVRGTLRNLIGDKTVMGAVKPALARAKTTLTGAMNQATERAGMQPGEWDRARAETGDLERQKRAMEDIAGHQIGRDTGVFDEAGSKEMTAYNRIHENRQSPSALDPFMHRAFPEAARREAFGSYVASLGRRRGGFRSQYLAEDLHPSNKEGMDPAFRDRLTERGGVPTEASQTLQDLGSVGGNTTTPTSRFGLTDTLGASGALVGALKGAGDIVKGAGHIGGMLASPLTYSTLYPISRWLESERMRQAQLGNREPVGNDIFSGLARAGAQAGQDPLDRKGTYWKNLTEYLTGGSKVPMNPSVQTPAKREPLIVPVAPTRR